ncbi:MULTISPECIES: VOC family protein [Micrococcaceae]|uniref:VOC family protein n=1 Tax=Micrococcaceae TaxID=1268 RepID=UPI000CFDE4B9|nr:MULTISPECIES: VOC family protein [unclassified Arthrobacter]PQZ84340.1 glyoxalase [Arthrobacter sp. MYb222]PRB73802.1 glyoxalase [Arthrobacter sp. MYb214]
MFTGMLSNCTVSNLARAEHWYARLFNRAPDQRPMDGLLEWHLAPGFGVQVFAEPDRAGYSTLVLEVADLDAQAARLLDAGIGHHGPQPGGGARIVQLQDPDGNRVVLASPLPGLSR